MTRTLLDNRPARRTGGQAVVEYAIILPLQLLIVLGFMQIAYLFVARHIVNYAAFCAARAALVSDDPAEREDAAAMACLKITGYASGESQETLSVPGWGELEGWDVARDKTSSELLPPTEDDPEPPPVRVRVTHYYRLNIPIANALAYKVGDVLFAYPDAETVAGYDGPHIPLEAMCTLARPWPNEPLDGQGTP